MNLEISIPANNAYLRIPLTLEAIELAKKFLELNSPEGDGETQ